jgi:hypothetical protein
MKQFSVYLLGELTAANFFALMFFALFGALLSLLLQTTNRNVNSLATPKHFSWGFFWEDNWKRIVTGLMLIYVALRFTPELFGITINEFWALAIGFLNDKLAQVVKDKTNLLGQKKEA